MTSLPALWHLDGLTPLPIRHEITTSNLFGIFFRLPMLIIILSQEILE